MLLSLCPARGHANRVWVVYTGERELPRTPWPTGERGGQVMALIVSKIHRTGDTSVVTSPADEMRGCACREAAHQ